MTMQLYDRRHWIRIACANASESPDDHMTCPNMEGSRIFRGNANSFRNLERHLENSSRRVDMPVSSRCPLLFDNMEIPVLSRITFDHYNNHSKPVECRASESRQTLLNTKQDTKYVLQATFVVALSHQLYFCETTYTIFPHTTRHGIPTLFDRPGSLVPAVG
jgi:hypothetical protein